MTAYTREIAAHRRPSKQGLAQMLEKLVRSKVELWEAVLARGSLVEGVLDRIEILEYAPKAEIAALRATRRGTTRSDLARAMAIVPESTDAAQSLVPWLALRRARMGDVLSCADHLVLVEDRLEAALRARADVVHANLRLVFGMARRFTSIDVQFEDMVADGNLGLITAVDRFDPSRKVLFSTYAVHWIRHAIGRSIDQYGRTVRIPVCARLLRRQITKVREDMARTGAVPSDEHVATEVGTSIDRLRQIDRDTSLPLRFNTITGSLITYGGTDFVTRDHEPIQIGDLARSAPERIELDQDVARLRAALPHLEDKRAFVLRHRFGLDDTPVLTLEEIGKKMGVSRERIRQHEKAALEDLRDAIDR